MDSCLHPYLPCKQGQFLLWGKGPIPSHRSLPLPTPKLYCMMMSPLHTWPANWASFLAKRSTQEMIDCFEGGPLVQNMECRFSCLLQMMEQVENGTDGDEMILVPQSSRKEKTRYGPMMLDMVFQILYSVSGLGYLHLLYSPIMITTIIQIANQVHPFVNWCRSTLSAQYVCSWLINLSPMMLDMLTSILVSSKAWGL